MKNAIFIILLLCLRSYASESELNCHGISVGPDGMAWDPNNSDQLVTGVVVCESKNMRRQTEYKDGLKHGKEYITYTHQSRALINTYNKGEKTMECNKFTIGTETLTSCYNLKTGETTQKRD